MKKATISLHTGTNSDHIDIFFETVSSDPKNLLTYEAKLKSKDQLLAGKPVKIIQKENHRKKYLYHDGEISENKGSLKIIWQGYYNEKIIFKNEFFIKIILKYIESYQ